MLSLSRSTLILLRVVLDLKYLSALIAARIRVYVVQQRVLARLLKARNHRRVMCELIVGAPLARALIRMSPFWQWHISKTFLTLKNPRKTRILMKTNLGTCRVPQNERYILLCFSRLFVFFGDSFVVFIKKLAEFGKSRVDWGFRFVHYRLIVLDNFRQNLFGPTQTMRAFALRSVGRQGLGWLIN